MLSVVAPKLQIKKSIHKSWWVINKMLPLMDDVILNNNITTHGILTFDIMSLNIMILGILTLVIMTLSIAA
jgi:hypothetical protein